MNIKIGLPLVALLLLLSGCGHTVYVTSRTSGITGQTTVTSTPGRPSGDMTLVLGGKTYTGRWIYMSGGGSMSVMSATATSGFRTASATGTAFNVPMSGNGTMILSAPGGASLHCVFNYSEWSSSGIGECEDEKGELYDVQIGK